MDKMKVEKKRFLGIGELVVDYIYKESQSPRNTSLAWACGGGSVWNMLCNLSCMGEECSAAGVGGDDDAGYFVRSGLESMGVNCDGLILQANRQTFRIHHIVPVDRLFVGDGDHRMGQRCPVCGFAQPANRIAKLRIPESILRDTTGFDVVLFDALNKARIQLAKQFQRGACFLVVDIGRIGHLRYRPGLDILETLRAFNLVVVPHKVLRFLAKKMLRDSNNGLVEEQEIVRILNTDAVLVTQGSCGARFYSWNKQHLALTNMEAVPLKLRQVVDPVGAGDAFVAAFIHCLSRRQLDSIGRRQTRPENFRTPLRWAARWASDAVVAVGARGHLLANSEVELPSKLRYLRGAPFKTLKKQVNEGLNCPLCGFRVDSSLTRSSKRCLEGIASRNVRLLRDRLMFAVEFSGVRRFKEVLHGLYGMGYAIGTGGSFPVAYFAANALNIGSKRFVCPIRPLDFIRTGQKCDYILVFTYSGKTTDCARAIDHARELDVKKIILVTGVKKPYLRSYLRKDSDEILSYAGKAREKGFVSIAGTVTPCALIAMVAANQANPVSWQRTLSEMYDSSRNIGRCAEKVYDQILRHEFVDVFGGGDSWPAMLDLESKFIESGIGRVTIHEAKDFSHGRFIKALERKQSTMLFFTVGIHSDYEEKLSEILSRYGDVVNINTAYSGILGSLDLLIKEQFLVISIGKMLKIDISKPRIPRKALDLYRWNKGLS